MFNKANKIVWRVTALMMALAVARATGLSDAVNALLTISVIFIAAIIALTED